MQEAQQPDNLQQQEPIANAKLEEIKMELCAAVDAHITVPVEVLWRRRKVGNHIPAGLWQRWSGETHSVEADMRDQQVLFLFFPQLNTDVQSEINLSPFPNKDVEYADVKILAPKGADMPGTMQRAAKKPRLEEKKPTQKEEVDKDETYFSKVADALRGDEKKTLVVSQLKVPTTITTPLVCFYPQLWIKKIADGVEAAQVIHEWQGSITQFLTDRGVLFQHQAKRDDWVKTKQEFCAWLHTTKQMPQSKEDYFLPFSICSRLAALVICAERGFVAEAQAKATLSKAFDEGYWNVANALETKVHQNNSFQEPGRKRRYFRPGKQQQQQPNAPQQPAGQSHQQSFQQRQPNQQQR